MTVLHANRLRGPDAVSSEQALRTDWRECVEAPFAAAGRAPPCLQMVASPYRSMVGPLLEAVRDAARTHPSRAVLIVLPELVEGRWWGYVMHTHRERRLRSRLLHYGGPNVSVVTVPWQLQEASPEQGIAEEAA